MFWGAFRIRTNVSNLSKVFKIIYLLVTPRTLVKNENLKLTMK